MPLIVNIPESMAKVRVITMKDDSEKTLKTLHKIGVLHVEESKELKPVDRAAIESERDEVKELLAFADNVLGYIPQEKPVPLGEDVEVIYTKPFSEISSEVKSLYSKVNGFHERIVKLEDEIRELAEEKRYLEPLAEQTNFRLNDLNFSGEYLFSRVFVLPSQSYEALYNRLRDCIFGSISASVEEETVLYVIAKVRDQKTIEPLVTEAEGKLLTVHDETITLREFIEITNGKIRNLEKTITGLREELQSKVSEDLSRVALLREALSAENERLSVLEKACEAKYVTLIEGWVPEKQVEEVISEVRQKVSYVFIDSRRPLDSEQPPSKLQNNRAVKPFQLIVEMFGTPKYREWDPTPIVAYSFALFFGIMTQDVIYSIGIILLTRFFLSKFVDDPNSEGFKLFQRVLYIGAGVGLIIGLLSGSYLADFFSKVFGIPSLAISKTVEQIFSNPMTLIVVAIGIGFIHVNIAHMVAFAMALKSKNKGIIVTKIGFFAFQISLILYAVSALLKPDLPILNPGMAQTFLYGIYGSLGILVVGVIMQNSYFGVLLWIFELTGFLGDALSYSRLAGIAMAGFYLGSAINMMAMIMRQILPGPVGLVLGTIAAFFVLIFGHLINTVLSIMGGFIHSLRLCLVEFMLKFYEGGGSKYSPFKLKTGESLIIREKA